jgi:pimeloyl-ACP methyl ester carboxylesterase
MVMSLLSDRCFNLRLLFFSRRVLVFTALVLSLSLALAPSHSWAADEPVKPEEKSDEDTKEPPPPDEIELTSEDGLLMKATYFPGTKAEESIPVILLHGAKGNRKDFTQPNGLAAYLQLKLGCAVIVPDLRGRGESIMIQKGDRKEKIDVNKMRPADYTKIPTQDLRAVKEYLWKKNNAKTLNMNKLAVIGVDMGAAVGLWYAADDANGYEQQTPRVGPLQLGEFVKCLVFISPSMETKGLTLPQLKQYYPKTPIFKTLAVLTLVGKRSKAPFAEAEKLTSLFEKARPNGAKLKIEEKTVLFLRNLDTDLQGVKMLDEPALNLPDKIVYFLRLRLIKNPKAKEEWAWKQLKLPHE